jgi:hypothetical protein
MLRGKLMVSLDLDLCKTIHLCMRNGCDRAASEFFALALFKELLAHVFDVFSSYQPEYLCVFVAIN